MVQIPGSWRPVNVGRFLLALPPSSLMDKQTQVLNGITLTVEGAPAAPLEAMLAQRAKDIGSDGHTPILAQQQWSTDSGAVLYVGDDSDPTYLEIEGRRLVPHETVVAVTSGDKSKLELMQKIVQKILGNYVPGDFAPGTFSRFGMKEGSLHQSFGDAEDVRAVFSLPQPGITLTIDSSVVAVPAKMDAFEREEQAVAVSKRDGLVVDVLRKDLRNVAGQQGLEVVDTGVSRKMRQFDAHFEAPGVPNSAAQTYLQINLATDDRQSPGVDEKQFLELWDTILDSFKVAP